MADFSVRVESADAAKLEGLAALLECDTMTGTVEQLYAMGELDGMLITLDAPGNETVLIEVHF